MDISIRCKNEVDTASIKRIKNISKAVINSYEEILESSYGEVPPIVIFDLENYTKDEMEKIIQDDIILKNLPTDTPEKFIEAYKEGMNDSMKDLIQIHYLSWFAIYQSDEHKIILKEKLLNEISLPLALSHELFHGLKPSRSTKATTNYLCDGDKALHSLIEGMADYMAISISNRLLNNGIITTEEDNYKNKYIQNLKKFYPISPEEKYMDTYAIYSVGYFYVKKKIDEGLPIKDITSLLKNPPKNMAEMYRSEIAERKKPEEKIKKSLSYQEILESVLAAPEKK